MITHIPSPNAADGRPLSIQDDTARAKADSAYNVAVTALSDNGTGIGDAAYTLAVLARSLATAGTNAAQAANVIAGEALTLAQAGTVAGFNVASYAAGSVYTVTNSAAGVVFGTTSPSVTITKAGTYALRAAATINLVGATFAVTRSLTLKLSRTNNTPADIANSSLVYTVPVVSALSQTLGVIPLPETIYVTSLTNDTVQLFAGLDVVPSIGSLTVNGASVVAVLLSV